MKKGKVFSKKQIFLAVLVLCLGAAVWINMKFSAKNGNFDLSNGEFVANGSQLGQAVEVGTGVSTLSTAKNELLKERNETIKTLSENIDKAGDNDSVKKEALTTLSKLTETMAAENNIETVLKAKGFNDNLVIIADESVTVMIGAESLLQSQTLQIQDAVTSQTNTTLDKIKIVTVK